MGKISKIKNQRGQTIIEALVIALAVIGLTCFLLLLPYVVIARKWADYWVYRAALCQATSQDTYGCQEKLVHKLSYVLPATFYKLESPWLTKKESSVEIQIAIGKTYRTKIQSTIPLPLVR